MPSLSDQNNIYKNTPIGIKPNGLPYTAFVIDDAASVRQMLRQILVSVKFKIIDEAENGEIALKKINNFSLRPDFIFVDMEMPILNGEETVKELKQILPQSRIIMVTAHGEKETVMKIINLGITGYIKKPFDRDMVLNKIDSILKLS